MSTSDTAALGSRPGLANVVDIIIAPGSAFARLREVPTWGWAFLVAALLGVAGSLLVGPAIAHAMEVSIPAMSAADPNMAKLPPEQQQKAIALQLSIARGFARWSFVFVPFALLIAALIQSVIMLVANAVTRGTGTFAKLFALSMTVMVVGEGLRSVVSAIIVAAHGVNSFDSVTALQGSVPSLAMLAPGVHGFLGGFLGALNVFYLWAAALLALGMIAVARIPRVPAWATAAFILIFTGCFAGLGALRNG